MKKYAIFILFAIGCSSSDDEIITEESKCFCHSKFLNINGTYSDVYVEINCETKIPEYPNSIVGNSYFVKCN